MRHTTTAIGLSVTTDDPRLTPLVDEMNAAPRDSADYRHARLALLVNLALHEAREGEYAKGHRDGMDEGAAPYLDGPWWKRAWTAARS